MNTSNETLVNEESEIDLVELFYLFRQKLLWILAALVIGGLGVGAFTYFFITPTYEATAKLYIVSASNDSVVNLSDLQIGTSLTADYQELVLSRPMMMSVIQNLDLEDTSVEDLRKMLTIRNPSGTRILEITATSTDPNQAERIANEMARLAVTWLPETMESNEPNISEEAIVPEKKAAPSYTKNTVIGAVVCAVLCYGFFVVRYLMDDSIRTSDELEKYFGLAPLTSIPEEKLDARKNRGKLTEGKREVKE